MLIYVGGLLLFIPYKKKRPVAALDAVAGRGSDVEGVGAHAVADHFRQDIGAALFGELQLLQDEDAGAFADDEAVAIEIPGTRGSQRIVIPGGERAHGGKAADSHRSD